MRKMSIGEGLYESSINGSRSTFRGFREPQWPAPHRTWGDFPMARRMDKSLNRVPLRIVLPRVIFGLDTVPW